MCQVECVRSKTTELFPSEKLVKCVVDALCFPFIPKAKTDRPPYGFFLYIHSRALEKFVHLSHKLGPPKPVDFSPVPFNPLSRFTTGT